MVHTHTYLDEKITHHRTHHLKQLWKFSPKDLLFRCSGKFSNRQHHQLDRDHRDGDSTIYIHALQDISEGAEPELVEFWRIVPTPAMDYFSFYAQRNTHIATCPTPRVRLSKCSHLPHHSDICACIYHFFYHLIFIIYISFFKFLFFLHSNFYYSLYFIHKPSPKSMLPCHSLHIFFVWQIKPLNVLCSYLGAIQNSCYPLYSLLSNYNL